MQLWKHKNGTFYILHGERLKRRVSTGTRDRREAEKYFAQFIAGAQEQCKQDPTVGEILTAYRDDRLLAVRSTQTLKTCVDALVPRLGDLLPSHLLPSAIKQYARERGVSDGTILREIGVLRAALSWAVEHQWMDAVRKPYISNPVKTPQPRDRWITKDEARKLIAGCQEPHIRLFIVLALMTVPRMSALLEAKWPQVDWDRRTIDYGHGHGNKRRAVVALNDEVLKALQVALEISCTDYIVAFRGKQLKTVKTGFAAACARAKLKDVTPHILRHSGATWMALDGVPMREISRMLGDSEATVERVYAKYHPDYLRRAAGALQLAAGG